MTEPAATLQVAPPAQPAMAVLLPSSDDVRAFVALPVFHEMDALLAAAPSPMGLYLKGWPAAQAAQALSRWRASAHWYRPAYVDPADPVPPGADGAAPLDQAVQACLQAEGVRRSVALDPASLHFDERLLYYLYLREPQELLPVLDRHSKYLYRYPQAEAAGVAEEDAGPWLGAIVRRQLMEPGQLVDRTRHCRRCQAAHLHFIDVCPQCSSLEIGRGASLHCFTCGHVAVESDFRSEGTLGCPQCKTRLRHIGVDYDRPLTRYGCGSCHHAFIEAVVRARCLECGHTTTPDDLDTREITTLRLTQQGRSALRAGQISESFAALDSANYVRPGQFQKMLDWALATQARFKDRFVFSLVLVEFLNADEVIAALGASRTYLMLDELARRLRETLRGTDLTTRTGESLLWVFLPYSSGSGFVARVQALLDEALPRDAPMRLQARYAHIEAPQQVRPAEQAGALMARLQAAPQD